MTDDEWDYFRESLKRWLSNRYLVEWKTGWQRHCCIGGDYAEPERTIMIIIEVSEAFSISFLNYAQEWLVKEAPQWRISIPTDNTDANHVFIYPNAIRINAAAEANLDAFVLTARESLRHLIEAGREQFGLKPKPKPHPPLPDET